MKLQEIRGIFPQLPKVNESKELGDRDKFNNIFTEFVKQVNTDQHTSSDITKDFLQGGESEIHEVMVAGQKAKTSLELLMEIRNKTVDMYKELTRMQ